MRADQATGSGATEVAAAPVAATRAGASSWLGWLLLAVVVVAGLAVGAARSSGPSSTTERVDSLTRQLACPICNGETVYESQNKASEDIRTEVTRLVREGAMSDDQILATIERSFPGSLLVPRGRGVDALVWALPAAAAVLCAAGLVAVFRRWRRELGAAPDADDRAMVEAALRALDDEERGDDAGASAVAVEGGSGDDEP